MSMSQVLKDYLEARGVGFQLVPHTRAMSSSEAAEAAHVPGALLAKTVVVVVEDSDDAVGVVVPSTKHVDLGAVREELGRQCGLATERSIERIFDDCETGSIPAVPQAYGLDVLVDDSLKGLSEVYFQAGAHTELARLSGEDFDRLMSGAKTGSFSEDWT